MSVSKYLAQNKPHRQLLSEKVYSFEKKHVNLNIRKTHIVCGCLILSRAISH